MPLDVRKKGAQRQLLHTVSSVRSRKDSHFEVFHSSDLLGHL